MPTGYGKAQTLMSGYTTPARTRPAMPIPLLWNRPNLRFIEGAGDGGSGDEGGKGGNTFTPITSQEDLEKVLGDRLGRERAKFKDFDQFKKDSDELRTLKKSTASEQDKAVNAAREEGRDEYRKLLVTERVTTALDKALAGRIPDTGALLALDRTQFVKDGAADSDAIKTWVEQHSTEIKTERQKDNSQGRRDGSAGSGSTGAGREAYERRHAKKTTTT